MAEDRTTSWALLATAGVACVATAAGGAALHRSLLTRQGQVFQQVQSELTEQLKATLETNMSRFGSQVLQKQDSILLQSLEPKIEWIKERFQNNRTRGRFGELQLEDLLRFSPLSQPQYDFQYTLSNNKRVDCVVHSKLGLLPIDSKFPLESLLEDDKMKIKQVLKKHITDIASKYILPGETTDYAIMFIPSDGDFQTVMEHSDIRLFAYTQRVYLNSPTTLLCSLHQLNAIARTVEVSDNHKSILQTVERLVGDVDVVLNRCVDIEKRFNLAKKEFDKMQTSIAKIRKHRAELESLGCFSTTTTNNKNGQAKAMNLKSLSAEQVQEEDDDELELPTFEVAPPTNSTGATIP